MASFCPKCTKPVYFAERVSSLGKNWHQFCLKCERCNKTLSAGGHAQHEGKPYCHKPCYAILFGPKGVNIGGGGSYVYDIDSLAARPVNASMQSLLVSSPDPSRSASPPTVQSSFAKPPLTPTPASTVIPNPFAKPSPPVRTENPALKAQPRGSPYTSFAGETAHCPGCGKVVYFAEKVTSLGRNWHRPCLRCERCRKTLTPGGHAQHEGKPYCHVPCYGILFGPKGVNIGDVGCFIYDN
ncbi:cysteine-rich protein 2-like isoform X1 [Carcharodon carcharias]|uniref:cysteine-rich protein 2-like isoform X1 n=1 Tax=Carcharodon carcharias TaxID=13397 RepID=UPI001B7EC432|nr:cysteine-rich protein 2-like isoform X1 [Carcharodon carcharias]